MVAGFQGHSSVYRTCQANKFLFEIASKNCINFQTFAMCTKTHAVYFSDKQNENNTLRQITNWGKRVAIYVSKNTKQTCNQCTIKLPGAQNFLQDCICAQWRIGSSAQADLNLRSLPEDALDHWLPREGIRRFLSDTGLRWAYMYMNLL